MIITGSNYSYETGGVTYERVREEEPFIASKIREALGNSRTVLNVGAGTGNYEPQDRYVLAVEPSALMRSKRPSHRSPAVIASAENLPFDDNAFDASMACLTIHHWPDLRKGLSEMRRVTSGPMVIMTFDLDALKRYWLYDYVPELPASDIARFPTIDQLRKMLGEIELITVPIPLNCVDGFQEAFYGRPELLLDPAIRKAQSGWSFVSEEVQERFVREITDDLQSGEWDRKYGHFRTQPFFEGALRLVVAR